MVHKGGNGPTSEDKTVQNAINTDRLMQLVWATTLHAPNQTPMPQVSKQLLNPRPTPRMNIIITCWAVGPRPYWALQKGQESQPKRGVGICIPRPRGHVTRNTWIKALHLQAKGPHKSVD